jgi:hypothetical protein
MVPQGEDADIDDVLKQSEALLDRIQSNQSERDFDSASLTSLTSLGSLLNISVRELTTPPSVMPSHKIRIPTSHTAPPLVSPSTTPRLDTLQNTTGLNEIPGLESAPPVPPGNASQELQPPPSPGRPPNWEKVSAAAQGDDDYVPIVDYSKLKPNGSQSSQRVVSSKVSRLEAYRKKAQRRRRRRRAIGFTVGVVLVIAFWVYSRRTEEVVEFFSKESTEPAGTLVQDEIIANESYQVEENLMIPVVEVVAENEAVAAPMKCILAVDEEFGEIMEEVCVEPALCTNHEGDSDVLENPGRENVEEKGESMEEHDTSSIADVHRGGEQFNDHLVGIEESRRGLFSFRRGEGLDVAYCRHPLARFLSKSCRNIAQGPRGNLYSLIEKPLKAMVENPVFLIV